MNSIDNEDKKQLILKYGKYLILIVVLVIAILFIRSCGQDYNDIENKMIELTKNYISKNSMTINNETYITITELGEIEGTELCSKASGVIVSNNNGSLKYQPYLKCGDYKTDVIKNKSKYIVLNGDEVFLLNQNEVFDDPKYYLKSEILDGDVVIEGQVGTNQGVYTLKYQVYVNYELEETLTRKVIVTPYDKASNVSGLKNITEPTLTLLGDKNMLLSVGSKYKEPGYLAVDYEDGKISRKVEVTGNVNTSSPGTYIITYSITNSKGMRAVEIRKVVVVHKKADLAININTGSTTASTNTILLSVAGNGYKSTVLPDGQTKYDNEISYVATENKIYTFKVYDIYDNEYIKEVDITSIDNILPVGSCKAVTTTTKTSVSVTASDNKGIAGYSFILDGNASEYQENKNYEVGKKATNIFVNVKDIAGNIAKISCTVEEGNEVYINEKGYNCLQPFTCYKQGDYSDYRYQFCSTDTCGPINKRGCSITSVTTLMSGFGVRDKNGNLYTPYTLLTDVYNKVCSAYCSGATAAKRAFEYVGLKVYGENHYSTTLANEEILKNHLRNGGAALLRVGKGWYTSGGHLMAILGINDEGLVYLYDPGARIGTSNGSHDVNTYVPYADIVKGGGESCWFQLVGK